MSDQPDLIKPKAVRLSHTGSARPHRQGEWRKLLVYLFLAGAAALVVALFVLAPRFVTPVATENGTGAGTPLAGKANPPGNGTAAIPPPSGPPPFEALRRQQARTEAQDALARFVELEIELREALRVESWNAEAYDGAKDLAHAGDESFVGERYAQAIADYHAAADTLAALIDDGHSRFETALASALEAIDAQDVAKAEASLAEARLVKPEDPQLQLAQARASGLPEIVTLFRQAHNQELAGQWDDALNTYERIRALDAQTRGLDQAVATAREKRLAQRLQSFLSSGFAQLADGHLSEAESSFKKALAMDPQNGAALGGLQQIAEQGLVREIDQLRRRAVAAQSNEDWPTAVTAFAAILELDANIQFARVGLAGARAQADALRALQDVSSQAESLSSDSRYAAAQETLSHAKGLEPRGPVLREKIAEVDELLRLYAQPVPVVLQSDNATEILLSNVGPLGKFVEKRLDLRPGAYTLVGSRDGCRDVRKTIAVRGEMAPVDIRCLEVLAH